MYDPEFFSANDRFLGFHQSVPIARVNLTCRARKSKPFIDHVLSFTLADSKIWFRNYQIQEKQSTEKGSETDIALLEIGPRFVLTPIIIFEGSFSGPVIYENKEFVSPNVVRSLKRKTEGSRYAGRKEAERERAERDGGMESKTGSRIRRGNFVCLNLTNNTSNSHE